MTIRVLSFDFDGCLFNEAYTKAPYTNFDKHLTDAVLIHNKRFLDQLRSENKQFSQVIAMIGSNRQSYEHDTGNMGTIPGFKGSCCSAMQTVCNYLDVDFNPLLLADLYNSLESGTSYQLIMEEIKAGKWIEMEETQEHQNCPMDEFKVALIFAQMQEAASKNPDEQIIFDFYDDRQDILAKLQAFYSTHPHMIPKNVLLRLNHYEGAEPTLEDKLVGDGILLNDYPDIVVNMLDDPLMQNDIALEIKSNLSKPETLDFVMQGEQFDSEQGDNELHNGQEKEYNPVTLDLQPLSLHLAQSGQYEDFEEKEQENQSVDFVGAAQVDEQTEKEAVEIAGAAPAIEEKQ